MIKMVERIFLLDGQEVGNSDLYRKFKRFYGKRFADSLVMERLFPP